MAETEPPLTTLLRQLRTAGRLSQLELSLRIGVSQRHVSFVESGRANASRELLLHWLHALDAPLAIRNQALLHAGFAPVYSAARLDDPVLAQANEAMLCLLSAHDPMPAFILDANWDVLHANRGGGWLATTLAPWIAQVPMTGPMNMLDMLARPDGFAHCILNLDEVGPPMLAHLRHDALSHPALHPRVEAVADMLHRRLGGAEHRLSARPPTAPVLTTRFATPHGVLAFFSMFTTFGTPQDITLSSLRVEHLFAADAATRAVVAAQVG